MAATPAGKQRPRSADYREIYINGCAVGGSAYDLQIIGLLTKSLTSGEVVNEEQIALRTSPQQFKSLVGMLLEVIVAYERDFQVLKLPAEQSEREAMLESIRDLVLKHATGVATFAGSSSEKSRRDAQSLPAPKKIGKKRGPSHP